MIELDSGLIIRVRIIFHSRIYTAFILDFSHGAEGAFCWGQCNLHTFCTKKLGVLSNNFHFNCISPWQGAHRDSSLTATHTISSFTNLKTKLKSACPVPAFISKYQFWFIYSFVLKIIFTAAAFMSTIWRAFHVEVFCWKNCSMKMFTYTGIWVNLPAVKDCRLISWFWHCFKCCYIITIEGNSDNKIIDSWLVPLFLLPVEPPWRPWLNCWIERCLVGRRINVISMKLTDRW